ncbi:hypothetical protein CEXT_320431 [Caerostris extrusa]|uniref:Uncharacterized protein n=1 Tax=Caerostris extrusa TaxID=172846 RepID=A0AAV4UB97_CAEEX|nr:hypothetical protein CEXT_320431 [Caerostris extrusa]
MSIPYQTSQSSSENLRKGQKATWLFSLTPVDFRLTPIEITFFLIASQLVTSCRPVSPKFIKSNLSEEEFGWVKRRSDLEPNSYSVNLLCASRCIPLCNR